jgi:hypothetical protein
MTTYPITANDNERISIDVERWAAQRIPELVAATPPEHDHKVIPLGLVDRGGLTAELLEDGIRVFSEAAIKHDCDVTEIGSVAWRPVSQIVAIANGFDGACALVLYFDSERGFRLRVAAVGPECVVAR